MFLKFDGAWRFTPPADGQFLNQRIPNQAVEEFYGLIAKVSTQGSRQEILEHFKSHFCAAVGATHVWSSSEGWAETDLQHYMDEASKNAPLFVEAFFDACETLRRKKRDYFAPDASMINPVCAKHSIGYQIRSLELTLRETEAPLVAVPDRPPTLNEQAIEMFQRSLNARRNYSQRGVDGRQFRRLYGYLKR